MLTSRLTHRAGLTAFLLALASSEVMAKTTKMVALKPDDVVGISFWFITMALVASSAFFFIESTRVSANWRTPLAVAGIVTMVAASHYFYVREMWVTLHSAPTVLRYIDWLVTVPLLMIQFYLVLSAITQVNPGVFWRILIGTVVMLAGGYVAEAGFCKVGPGFTVGMLGWFAIIYEIFQGEASQVKANKAPKAVATAFNQMRMIVLVGWAIYPFGFYVSYFADDSANTVAILNAAYNLADVVNKIGFGAAIWAAATTES